MRQFQVEESYIGSEVPNMSHQGSTEVAIVGIEIPMWLVNGCTNEVEALVDSSDTSVEFVGSRAELGRRLTESSV